jgi:hypothetical protein
MVLTDLLKRRHVDGAAALLADERKRRKQLQKQLKKESTVYQGLIVRRLNQLNLCYRYKKWERDWFEGGIQSLRFLRAAANIHSTRGFYFPEWCNNSLAFCCESVS